MRRPAYGNAAAWRAVAVLNLVLAVIQLPYAVLRHGVPVLWQDYPAHLRWIGKTLWTGRPGPSAGVMW